MPTTKLAPLACYHCGDACDKKIQEDKKVFCCEGCKQVYLLLNENNLCSYYDFENNPGLKVKGKHSGQRFAYLEDDKTIEQLVQFKSETQINVTFYLSQIHCTSCVFLLENLPKINPGIIQSTTNFQRKEVFIVFNPQIISLREVVELLSFVGYEPNINLTHVAGKKAIKSNRTAIYKIGLAGFCFANIMMLSFPEYFSGGSIEQAGLKSLFSYLILALSIPILIWCASEFFISAYKSLRQGMLNIDAPIALATVITFTRSYYEIISGTGAGFLDSGTAIVFFMLVGRWFQNKTYDSFSFDRDYKSYFPLGVSILKDNSEQSIPLTNLKKGDCIVIRNEELIPADGILLAGAAKIDYRFISGEKDPVCVDIGSFISRN